MDMESNEDNNVISGPEDNTLELVTIVLSVLGAWMISILFIFMFIWKEKRDKRINNNSSNSGIRYKVGFFHPYCNAGGGGERVLFMSLFPLLSHHNDIDIFVFTGDVPSTPTSAEAFKAEIMKKTKERFDIDLSKYSERINFIMLKKRQWVEANEYPRFTLLGQSLGSLVLAYEAMKLVEFDLDMWIDSMGYAFPYPLVKLLIPGCKLCCYVHYPTISSDMLNRVRDRRPTYNNDERVTSNSSTTTAKLVYYKVFAWMYGFVGRFADTIMVNSTWTRNHIVEIWHKSTDDVKIVYPPCEIPNQSISKMNKRINTILSIGQFRPEKDHKLQINALKCFLDGASETANKDVKLVLLGSCRNKEDDDRVKELMELVDKLRLKDNVEFKVNASYKELQELLDASLMGIHSMWNEHFGVSLLLSLSCLEMQTNVIMELDWYCGNDGTWSNYSCS